MAANDIRRNFNLFVDGTSYAGQIEEFTPPKLALKTEEIRCGGMDAPMSIALGMEKLEASFSLISFSKGVLSLLGVTPNGQDILFVAREALESYNGTVTPVVYTMRGRIKEMDYGTIKSGDKASLKVAVVLSYYKLEHGASVVHEIDVPNMVRLINGIDQMAQIRVALGI